MKIRDCIGLRRCLYRRVRDIFFLLGALVQIQFFRWNCASFLMNGDFVFLLKQALSVVASSLCLVHCSHTTKKLSHYV